MSNVSDIPTLLEEIRKRPCLYHGGKERCIDLFTAFLSGILYLQNVQSVPIKYQLNNFNWKEFEKWVEKEFNEKKLSLNSLGLSKLKASSNSEAFDLWFNWYDQFQQSKK